MTTIIPLGWIAQTENVAGALAFLAGDEQSLYYPATLVVQEQHSDELISRCRVMPKRKEDGYEPASLQP